MSVSRCASVSWCCCSSRWLIVLMLSLIASCVMSAVWVMCASSSEFFSTRMARLLMFFSMREVASLMLEP